MRPKSATNTNAFGVETEGIQGDASNKKVRFQFTKKRRYLHFFLCERRDGDGMSLHEQVNRCCYFAIEVGKYLRRFLP
jgi:hypothetical protein